MSVNILNKSGSLKISVYFLLAILLFAVAGILVMTGFLVVSVIMYLVAGIITILGIRRQYGQWFSITIVFFLFHLMYGLSVPLAIILGYYTSETYGKSVIESNFDVFLCLFSLASIGFIFGCGANRKRRIFTIQPIERDRLPKRHEDILIVGVYISAILTTSFELINLFRIGGLAMLFLGKGVVQSAVGDLTLTLPSADLYAIYGMYSGLIIGYLKLKQVSSRLSKHVVISFVFLLPFVICKLILGQRAALVSALLAGMACYTAIYPIKKISFKLCVLLFMTYILMAFLYSNRGIVRLLLTNPDEFWQRALDWNRLLMAINPSSSEFGAGIGNFCVFFNKYRFSFDHQFGLTYLKGLVVPIPSVLYPGSKPKQITYAFRDEFFLSWAARSRVASTGFSSILEAYMNWNVVGVLLVYILVGMIIRKLDKTRCKSNDMLHIMLCSSLINVCVSFSRDDFGAIWTAGLYDVLYTYVIFYITRLLRIRKN